LCVRARARVCVCVCVCWGGGKGSSTRPAACRRMWAQSGAARERTDLPAAAVAIAHARTAQPRQRLAKHTRSNTRSNARSNAPGM
jgi:hypothetical protein